MMEEEMTPILCETPQRDVEQEYFDDILSRQVGDDSLTDQYLEIVADSGTGEAVSQLQSDVFLELVTIDGARIRKSHSIDPTADGIVVGIKFLNGTQKMQDAVMKALGDWEDALEGSLSFAVSSHANALRTTFESGNKYVHASKIGNRLVSIAEAKRFETNPNSSSARGIVLHEFGHALGLEHEHFSPHLDITWRSDQEIADHINQHLKPGTVWTTGMVKRNITGPRPNIQVCGDKLAFDKKSVMGYAIWPQWNLENITTAPAHSLSNEDIACAQRLYPSGI